MSGIRDLLLVAVDPTTRFEFDVDALIRLLIAAGLGAVVGAEREAGDQPAGLRTHIAVASGAALFGIISTLGFLEFETLRNNSNINVDVTRVASNVVVGIGFLGAGVVFRRRNAVHNLTTAASLWAVAAIGLAAGVGDIATAIIATAILFASLVLLRPLRDWIRQQYAHTSREIEIGLAPGIDATEVLHQVARPDQIERVAIEKDRGRVVVLTRLQGHPDEVQRLIDTLAAYEEVETLHEV